MLRREKPQNDATVGADDFLSFFGGSSYAGKKLTGVLGDPTIPYSNVSKRTQGYCRFTVDDEKQKVKGWTWGKGGGVQEFSGCHFRTFNSGSDTPGKHAGRERTKSQCLYEMNLSKIRDRTHGIPSACTSGNYSEGNPCHEWLSKYGWCGKTWAHKDGGTDCRPETDVVRNKMINGSDDWWSCNWPNMEKSGDGCACKEGFWFNALLQECVRDEGGVDSIMDQWWTEPLYKCVEGSVYWWRRRRQSAAQNMYTQVDADTKKRNRLHENVRSPQTCANSRVRFVGIVQLAEHAYVQQRRVLLLRQRVCV